MSTRFSSSPTSRRTSRWRLRSIAAVTVVSLLAASCGGDDDDSPAADDDGGEETVEESTDTGTDEAVEEDESSAETSDGADDETSDGEASADEGASDGGAAEGTIVYTEQSFGFAAGGFDPALQSGNDASEAMFVALDRLVHVSPEGDLVPGLATSWEFSDDGLELTLGLRPDVVFQDGTPLNADAVVANIERSQTIEGSAAAPSLAAVSEVVADDDLTVRFVLSEPDPVLPTTLSGKPGAMISPDSFDNGDIDLFPIGAGMYRVVEHEPDSRVLYERWDGYWDPEAVGAAAVERLVQPEGATRANNLTTGAVDIAELSPETADEVASADGVEVVAEPSSRWTSLQFNRAEGTPLADADVRRALNMAIDRDAIVQAIAFGYGEPSSQAYPTGHWAHWDELDDLYPYDPEAARQMLADAGYPDGFSIELLAFNIPLFQTVAEAVQAQFAEVGVDMSVELDEPANIAQRCWGNGECGAMTISRGGPEPTLTLAPFYLTGSPNNPPETGDPTVDEIVERASQATDEETRREIVREFTRYATEDALDLIIWNERAPIGLAENVTGFEYYVNGINELRGVGVGAD